MFSISSRTEKWCDFRTEFISGRVGPTSKGGSRCCFPTLPGYIKNTEKLNYGKEHQYKLTVTAYDCGKKRATEDVLVKISVKPTCSPGWQGESCSLSSSYAPSEMYAP